MAYVDGFVVPVPRRNLAAYRRMAAKAGRIWREHGALEYVEAAGDDLDVEMGRPFPRQLSLKRGETVVFAWILYRSRAHRDEVNAKVMKDPRMAAMPKVMPFDVQRMLYGGFRTLVQLDARSAAAPRSRRRQRAAARDGKLAAAEEAAPTAH